MRDFLQKLYRLWSMTRNIIPIKSIIYMKISLSLQSLPTPTIYTKIPIEGTLSLSFRMNRKPVN